MGHRKLNADNIIHKTYEKVNPKIIFICFLSCMLFEKVNSIPISINVEATFANRNLVFQLTHLYINIYTAAVSLLQL